MKSLKDSTGFESRVINGCQYYRYSYWDKKRCSEVSVYAGSYGDLLAKVEPARHTQKRSAGCSCGRF